MDERERFNRPPGTPADPFEDLPGADDFRHLLHELDGEVYEMVNRAIHCAGPGRRHTVLFACSRTLGGYLARFERFPKVVEALRARYTEVLVEAAGDSRDAARAVRDGIDSGLAFPIVLPSESVAALFGEEGR